MGNATSIVLSVQVLNCRILCKFTSWHGLRQNQGDARVRLFMGLMSKIHS